MKQVGLGRFHIGRAEGWPWFTGATFPWFPIQQMTFPVRNAEKITIISSCQRPAWLLASFSAGKFEYFQRSFPLFGWSAQVANWFFRVFHSLAAATDNALFPSVLFKRWVFLGFFPYQTGTRGFGTFAPEITGQWRSPGNFRFVEKL